MSRIDQSAAAIVRDARTAYEAARGGDGEGAAAAALDLAVEAFHLGQLLKAKGEIGKAARKRAATEPVSVPSTPESANKAEAPRSGRGQRR
jgi:hypothetical protein